MKTAYSIVTFFVLSAILPVPAAEAATGIIWDIAGLGIFDSTNKAYQIDKGQVVVDLHDKTSLCPTGLGHLASGRSTVKTILIQYKMQRAGKYWLHVTWNPGGSGKEQFEVIFNGKSAGKSFLLDGSKAPRQNRHNVFMLPNIIGDNKLVLKFLSGDGLHFKKISLAATTNVPHGLKPTLKFPTLASYEREIKEPGVLLDDKHIRLYAPSRKNKEARIIFGYLVKAYDELYRIVGMHTKYKMVVYHFPESNPNSLGGTSECTIRYGYKNLDFASHEEWTQYKIPHVSGYIEEMAHNFVGTTKMQFGWEMVGWTISIKASEKVAANPIFRRSLQETRRGQEETFKRYRELGYIFPKNLPATQCDRLHAYILWKCEKQYGEKFWPDFFREIHKQRARFIAAEKLSGEEGRNARYRITIDCFDRLMKGNFKKILRENRISLTTDIKSLHPLDKGWNRKFR